MVQPQSQSLSFSTRKICSSSSLVDWWVLSWLAAVGPLIILLQMSAALPVQDLSSKQPWQWEPLTDLSRPVASLSAFASSDDLSNDSSLPMANVPVVQSNVQGKRSRQRRNSHMKALLDSTIHFDGEVLAAPLSGTDLKPLSLVDMPSLLHSKRANRRHLETKQDDSQVSTMAPVLSAVSSSPVTSKPSPMPMTVSALESHSKNMDQSIQQTGMVSKISPPARVFRLKTAPGQRLPHPPQNSQLILTKSRRFVPKGSFKAHVRHSGHKLETLFLSIFDKSLPKNDIFGTASQEAQTTPKWRHAVLSYLLNMKTKDQTIEDLDLSEGEILAEEAIRPEDEQNVVCKVSPYRVCYHLGNDGKLRPLRKARQLMNTMRVY